jgi:hypothetical protein
MILLFLARDAVLLKRWTRSSGVLQQSQKNRILIVKRSTNPDDDEDPSKDTRVSRVSSVSTRLLGTAIVSVGPTRDCGDFRSNVTTYKLKW